jgi:hypothetical protein
MKIGGPINFLPGANRGTEIRPAIFACDALHNFLSEACSTLRIGHHYGSVQVMAAQKTFDPALPPVVQRHIEWVISSLQPKGVVKEDSHPCATLSEQNVQCLFDIATRRAYRKDVRRTQRALRTEGWLRFPRSIIWLTPKRDVAGRSATAYLKHLLDLFQVPLDLPWRLSKCFCQSCLQWLRGS